jgi:four helix bundle protein
VSTAKRFEELEVWQRAKELTILIYRCSADGAFARDPGLRDQMRRAGVSVMSNIAEGFESPTQQTFVRYLGHAKASAGEVRAQLYIALEQEYLTKDQFQSAYGLAETCSKQLARFIKYLENQPNSRRVREDGVIYEY